MSNISTEIKFATFENIIVECPYCFQELIFNRVSELETIMPISDTNLKCKNCEKEFWASGDFTTSAKYNWFLDDLFFLKKNKKYGLYILALCQACEIFMHEAIINKTLDKNIDFRDEEGRFIYDYKEIYDEFNEKKISEISHGSLKDKTKYKKAAFDKLRYLFLNIFEDERKNKMPNLKKCKGDKRESSFYVLEKTNINFTRNDIVHKNAYRPSFSDIQKYDDLISSLYWLGIYLDVNDSMYFLNKTIKNKYNIN